MRGRGGRWSSSTARRTGRFSGASLKRCRRPTVAWGGITGFGLSDWPHGSWYLPSKAANLRAFSSGRICGTDAGLPAFGGPFASGRLAHRQVGPRAITGMLSRAGSHSSFRSLLLRRRAASAISAQLRGADHVKYSLPTARAARAIHARISPLPTPSRGPLPGPTRGPSSAGASGTSRCGGGASGCATSPPSSSGD